MRYTPERHTDTAGRTVKDIRRKTRKRYSSVQYDSLAQKVKEDSNP